MPRTCCRLEHQQHQHGADKCNKSPWTKSITGLQNSTEVRNDQLEPEPGRAEQLAALSSEIFTNHIIDHKVLKNLKNYIELPHQQFTALHAFLPFLACQMHGRDV